jgi:hypothetical protein
MTTQNTFVESTPSSPGLLIRILGSGSLVLQPDHYWVTFGSGDDQSNSSGNDTATGTGLFGCSKPK